MRFGIDFGTSRTIVTCCDRGNFPILSFLTDGGDMIDGIPSIVAVKDGELRYGLDALAVASDPVWSVKRSFKRALSDPGAGPDHTIDVGGWAVSSLKLVTGFLSSLRRAILERSNMPARPSKDEEFVAAVATPANALGAQRFVTLDAFRRAGFKVQRTMNEPSAAGFEYTYRHRNTLTSKREHGVVYDLGGGTFDASLVRMGGASHDVLATSGLPRLGGDDFDDRLAEMVLQKAQLSRGELHTSELSRLLDRCREAKEALTPSSRKIVIDLEGIAPGDGEASIPVTDFYERTAPFVERTIEAMSSLLVRSEADSDGDPLAEVAGIYVVGGASSLPSVGRVLRERFGRRVHRSPYPSAATAVGLAIAADEGTDLVLSDHFARTFGVFRETREGQGVAFDAVFGRETRLPGAGEAPRIAERTYRAVHNIGRFRFVECASTDAEGAPLGELPFFGEIVFPFDRALQVEGYSVDHVPVARMRGPGPIVRERYTLDEHGIVQLTMTDLESGYERAFRIGS